MKNFQGRGITLFDMLVAVFSIIVVFSGFFLIARGFDQFKKKKETKKRIEKIVRAMEKFAEDNGRFPADITHLLINPGIYPSWRGPYFSGDYYTLRFDAWRGPFQYTSVLTYAAVWSMGQNGVNESSPPSPSIGWTPGGDDIGTEISFKGLSYDRLLITKIRVLEVVRALEDEFSKSCKATKFSGAASTKRNYFLDFSIRSIFGVDPLDGYGNAITCGPSNSSPCSEVGDGTPDPSYEVIVYGTGFTAVAIGHDCSRLRESGLGCVNIKVTSYCTSFGSGFTSVDVAIPPPVAHFSARYRFKYSGETYSSRLVASRVFIPSMPGGVSYFTFSSLPYQPLVLLCSNTSTLAFSKGSISATYTLPCTFSGLEIDYKISPDSLPSIFFSGESIY